MTNKSIVFVCIGFLLVVFGLYGFTYIQKQKSLATDLMATTTVATTTDTYQINRIEAKHFFRNGVHTIVGEMTMPTPCDLLATKSRVAESMPEQITYDFSVINTTSDCEAKPTKQRFSVSAKASDQANLSATFRGAPVSLNMIEAGDEETPESYELFIKG